jgi:Zn-dependent protease
LTGLDLTEILVGFLVLVSSLTVHEAAHAWVATRLGDSTARMLGRLSLNPAVHVDPIGTIVFPLLAMATGVPLIGWAKPVPVNPRNLASPRRDFALIAAAGPASNLLLAVAGAALLHVVPGGLGLPSVNLDGVLAWFVVVNVLLAIFNMIPVPPLDGGNVLMGILPASGAAVVDRLRPYGFVLLYVLMLSGLLSAITRPAQRFVLGWLL